MKSRTTNPGDPRYKDYGGRGIRLCERWERFDNFLSDMGTRPEGTTLERDRNDEGYEPGNCRWATSREQSRNKRSCVYIQFNGVTKILADWASDLGITGPSLKWRIAHWGLSRAMTTMKEENQ